MKIYINKHILDRFRQENISLDYVGTIIVILICIYEQDFQLLDDIDDGNKSKRLLLLYRYLLRRGILEEVPSENDEIAPLYCLSDKGEALVNFIQSFDESEMEVRKECASEILETEQKIEEWIADYLNLFPEGKYFGRSLRTNTKDCLDRMRWFLNNYTYSREQIFNATKQYLEAQRTSPEGYKYTRNSTYFICKGKGGIDRVSDLSTECEKVVRDGYKEVEYIERDSS